jgi:hypothetical protein
MADLNQNLRFDDSNFLEGMSRLGRLNQEIVKEVEKLAAGEILRLSTKEVPHDKGMLQDSGTYGADVGDDKGAFVGYDSVYAAHLHEHPQYHFQKGRKGKFLEDPMKNNTDHINGWMGQKYQEMLA